MPRSGGSHGHRPIAQAERECRGAAQQPRRLLDGTLCQCLHAHDRLKTRPPIADRVICAAGQPSSNLVPLVTELGDSLDDHVVFGSRPRRALLLFGGPAVPATAAALAAAITGSASRLTSGLAATAAAAGTPSPSGSSATAFVGAGAAAGMAANGGRGSTIARPTARAGRSTTSAGAATASSTTRAPPRGFQRRGRGRGGYAPTRTMRATAGPVPDGSASTIAATAAASPTVLMLVAGLRRAIRLARAGTRSFQTCAPGLGGAA